MGFWDERRKRLPAALQPEPTQKPGLMELLERLVVALERLAGAGRGGFRAPGAPDSQPAADISYVDNTDEAIRELKRYVYERRSGRSLAEDEDPPELPSEEVIAPQFVAPGEGEELR